MSAYAKEPRNTVKRIGKRGLYDYASVHSTLASAPILYVSFTPSSSDPFPTILPMIGFVGNFSEPSAPLSEGDQYIYLHGHSAARLMQLPSSSSSSPGVVHPQGLPVCVAATHIDGIVIALTPFHNSMNYRSAVVHGYASAVTDEEERLWAMEKITDAVVPGRWADSRVPNKAELLSTGILRVEIVSASAKWRRGGPAEDRKDEKDEGVRGKYWTGVVPAMFTLGEPVDAEKNRVEVPAAVREWIEGHNKEVEKTAKEAIRDEGGGK